MARRRDEWPEKMGQERIGMGEKALVSNGAVSVGLAGWGRIGRKRKGGDGG